ncbi:hypothetical protein SAMN05421788_10350 [Filimonas lacunae]|uniref:Uncharacterized protein n=1 Tax=Filimonas lacunae TaxID=477680 RepID=A0A1N7NZC3_9BACT|nr:hypothetical protein [Filimonas lacunae]SIT03715.1 hypothetical protein SAMN05421788_10350 [Filimonas lacunae]
MKIKQPAATQSHTPSPQGVYAADPTQLLLHHKPVSNPLQLLKNRQYPANGTNVPVQRMLIESPPLPEYDEDDALTIDTTGMQTQHIPDEPYHTVDYMLKKLSAAWTANYGANLFAQDEITRLKAHLRRTNAIRGYGEVQEEQRIAIIDLYNNLTRLPNNQRAPSFQGMIVRKFAGLITELQNRDALYSAQIRNLLRDLTDVDREKTENDANNPAAKSNFYNRLRYERVAPHNVPEQNRYVSEAGKAHAGYTVGASKEVWVSVHGATAGQDVMSWPSSADLNYKYNLVHAKQRKLVAGHLLPAWLGGLRVDENLTPIPNEANGWLAANPELVAKQMVFSDGDCVKYEVQFTFARAVPHGIGDDVAGLVPSGIVITLTRLAWNNTGDATDWANYVPAGASVPYHVPADRLLLDHDRMLTKADYIK